MNHSRPRRIVHAITPGSLLKRVGTPAPRVVRKSYGDHDAGYLANIRACPCLKCGMEPSEAAHVRMASAAHGKASGLQKKPADRWALPLCAGCHRLGRDAQHHRSEQQFWHEVGINPLMVCAELYAQRHDLVAMRAVVLVAIAGRGK